MSGCRLGEVYTFRIPKLIGLKIPASICWSSSHVPQIAPIIRTGSPVLWALQSLPVLWRPMWIYVSSFSSLFYRQSMAFFQLFTWHHFRGVEYPPLSQTPVISSGSFCLLVFSHCVCFILFLFCLNIMNSFIKCDINVNVKIKKIMVG